MRRRPLADHSGDEACPTGQRRRWIRRHRVPPGAIVPNRRADTVPWPVPTTYRHGRFSGAHEPVASPLPRRTTAPSPGSAGRAWWGRIKSTWTLPRLSVELSGVFVHSPHLCGDRFPWNGYVSGRPLPVQQPVGFALGDDHRLLQLRTIVGGIQYARG